MLKRGKKRLSKIGLPPGTPVYVGDQREDKVEISIIDYDETQLKEGIIEDVEECFPYKETPSVTWINIDGIHRVEIIEKIGKHFSLHPLVQEDIVHTEQRPKMEEFDGL